MAEDLLVALDMRRNSVKVLIYMAEHDEVTSDELEVALGIGQPSVSAAVKDIGVKGWLSVEQIHTNAHTDYKRCQPHPSFFTHSVLRFA